jgi:hypothetical protein
MKPTQVERLLAYLAANPGATGLEIVTTLAMPKYTSRISDARDQGHTIECRKRPDGRDGYWIVPRRVVTTGEQVGLAL